MVKQNKKSLMFRGYYSFDSLMTNVYYLAKWNPREAMVWMEEAKYFIEGEWMETRYNKVVDQINSFLDSLEKKSYYDKKEFWQGYPPERATYHYHFNF